MKKILTILLIIGSIFLYSQSIDTEQLDINNSLLLPERPNIKSGRLVPSSGVFKVLVIYIDKENDPNNPDSPYNEAQSSVWPIGSNPIISYALVNDQPYNFRFDNISKYTYEMSNGSYQIIGDSYNFTLPFNFNTNNIYDAITFAFQQLDNEIDYSQYDNWNNSGSSPYMYDIISNEADGFIDYCFIIFRSPLKFYSSGLPSGQTGIFPFTSSDIKIINGQQTNVKTGMGSISGGYINGYSYIQSMAFHEFAHDLLQDHTGRLAKLSCITSNEVGWHNYLVGMNAFEKESLGWLNYTTVNSDAIITLSDYMSSGSAIKIPTNYSSINPNETRYFIIENRQKINELYDKAFGKGLYIYRASSHNLIADQIYFDPDEYPVEDVLEYDGFLNLLSADGRYIFNKNFHRCIPIDRTDIRLSKGDPHVKGYDERDFYERYISPPNYNLRTYCIYIRDPNPNLDSPWYIDQTHKISESHPYGDAFGDNFDGFSLGFNKVFSKWTNPGIDPVWSNNTNFSIEILNEDPLTGDITFHVRFTNPEDAPLGRPMGLKVSLFGAAYLIDWFHPNHPLSNPTDLQPGFDHYNVYYKTNINPTWRLLGRTTNTSYNAVIPFDEVNPNVFTINRTIYFKVSSVNEREIESNFSDIYNIELSQNHRIPSLSISNNNTLIIDDSLSIVIDSCLVLEEGSSLILGTGSQIIINPEATLNIASNSIIQGTNRTQGDILGSRIIVNGNLTVGDNVSFTSDNGSWDGIEINSINPITLNNANFVNADLYTNRDVNITNSTFDNSTIYQRHSSLSISNSQFVKSCVNAFTKVQGVSTMIKNSAFDGNMDMEAIQLNSIEKYSITENTINNYGIGISLYETTFGYIERNQISDNRIGIQMYHAGANITNANIVENNDYGIVAYRKSLWSLEGSKSAPYQKIINNKYAQVLFSYDSAPEYAEFNQIYKSVYSAKPLVTCTNVPTNPKKIIFTNNYFGSNFDPKYNLEPNDIYDYSSAWEPEIDLGNLSTIPETYKSAKESEKNGNYTEAKEIMLSFYSAVPDSSILLDKSSKQLLALEKLTSLNYNELTSFYQSYNGQDSEIINLFDYLQNCCALNLNEYQTAISWLETQITDPITQLDSLFATIDIAYIYLLMENKRSANVVSNIEYLKPSSFSSFTVNRMQLMNDLLFDDGVNENNQSSQVIKEINLFQNYPNPANPSTTISFSLPEDSNIELSIFNVKGQKVKTLKKEYLSKGTHNIIWEGNDSNNNKVASGIYFYKLITKGQTYTKKMILMK